MRDSGIKELKENNFATDPHRLTQTKDSLTPVPCGYSRRRVRRERFFTFRKRKRKIKSLHALRAKNLVHRLAQGSAAKNTEFLTRIYRIHKGKEG